MVRSNLCDYSDAYIQYKSTVPNKAAAAAPINNTKKKLIFKHCAPFTNWISKVNNTQVHDIDDILLYNLMEIKWCLFEDIIKFMAIL